METKLKVLEFANKVSRKKMGAKNAIQPGDPEYRILEPVVTDEMAEVALCLEFRKPQTAADVAALCGKPLERTAQLLWELSLAGVCFVNNIDGEDRYWYDTWIPGIMEMMTNNKENVRKYPQIAESFEAYGRVRGPATTGKIAATVMPAECADLTPLGESSTPSNSSGGRFSFCAASR